MGQGRDEDDEAPVKMRFSEITDQDGIYAYVSWAESMIQKLERRIVKAKLMSQDHWLGRVNCNCGSPLTGKSGKPGRVCTRGCDDGY